MTSLRHCCWLISVLATAAGFPQTAPVQARQQFRHISSVKDVLNSTQHKLQNGKSPDLARSAAAAWNTTHTAAGAAAAAANSSRLVTRSQYFAICVAVKDQHADVSEWVEHHEKLGAGKIYVYDDSSDPPMRGQLERYIQSGLVEYNFLAQANHTSIERPQLWIYNECINKYRTRHQFMGFIDVDEFLFLRNHDHMMANISALLQEFEAYGGLAVNWVLFGSSGHTHRPEGGTLASYWKCVPQSHPENLHVKTIANMKYVAHVSGTPHFFYYNEGKNAVDETFTIVDGPRTGKNVIERVALYHYVTKSKEEFQNKSARGSGMKNHKPDGFFDAIQTLAVDDCRDGMQWARRRHHQQ